MKNTLKQAFLSILQKNNILSIEDLDFTQGDTIKESLAAFFDEHYFHQSADAMFTNIKQTKQLLDSELYGLQACMFQNLTGIEWNDMFDKAFVISQPHNRLMKVVSPWFHIILGSEEYRENTVYQIQGNSTKYKMRFRSIGKELVELDGIKYVVGESSMIVNKAVSVEGTFIPRIINPVMVIDSRLIDLLRQQPNYAKVMECIYLLYHITSHDGYLHSIFMETDPDFRKQVSQEKELSKLLQCNYLIYDMFEINYVKMRFRMFDEACKLNRRLKTSVINLMTYVIGATRDWDSLAKQYAEFMVHDRAERILPYMFVTQPRFVEADLVGGGTGIFKNNGYLRYFLQIQPNKEAIVHDEHHPEGEEISYAQIAKYVYNYYDIFLTHKER